MNRPEGGKIIKIYRGHSSDNDFAHTRFLYCFYGAFLLYVSLFLSVNNDFKCTINVVGLL